MLVGSVPGRELLFGKTSLVPNEKFGLFQTQFLYHKVAHRKGGKQGKVYMHAPHSVPEPAYVANKKVLFAACHL